MSSPRERTVPDETDLALIDALHVNPRATAEQLSRGLDLSPSTVARRWRRLVDRGQAWVSSAPGPALPVTYALFEAECVPGRAEQVADTLAALPAVVSVGHVTGSIDVYAFVAAADPARLWRLLTHDLPAVPGLLRTRTSVLSTLFYRFSWRLGALDRVQTDAVRATADSTVERRDTTEFERDLHLALQRDGRASHRELAAELGRSEQAVARRVTAMQRSGLLAFRTDFVRPDLGWRAHFVLRLHAPPGDLHSVGQYLQDKPGTRVCAAVIGVPNLVCTVLLQHVGGIDEWLRDVAARWPDLAVVDQHVVLRTVKSWGRLLDDDGFAAGIVPVDLWQ